MTRASNDGGARLAILAAGFIWAANFQFIVSEWVTMAAALDYSPWHQDISVLGITVCAPYLSGGAARAVEICSPSHMILNISLFVLGLQVVAGMVLSRGAWPGGVASWLGQALVVGSGVGLLLVGGSPLDRSPDIHYVGAVMNFCLGGAGFVLLGLASLRPAPHRGRFSLACGLTCLIATMLYAAQVYGGLGRGGMERIAAYSMTAWFVGTGIALLAGQWRAAAARP